MADKEQPTDLIENGPDVTIGKRRHGVALEAAWEIDELSQLCREVYTSSSGVENFALRGLCIRIGELTKIIMGALGDDNEATDDLAFRLRQKHEEVTA